MSKAIWLAAALAAAVSLTACAAPAPPPSSTPQVAPSALPSATPPPAASPTATAVTWREYLNDRYHVSLWYPAHWEQVEASPGFQGPDGFVGLTMWGVTPEAATLTELCAAQAQHPLQPFGSAPTVTELTVSGQPACLIWPAADQPLAANGRPLAEAVIAYPEIVNLDGVIYQFLIVDADPEHLPALLERLTLILFDSLNTPPPAPTVTPAAACARTHVVQAGERLTQIAEQYGLDWPAIAALNGLSETDLIYPGQSLCLPAAADAPGAEAAPVIVHFTAAPADYRPGEPITVSWGLQNAAAATLRRQAPTPLWMPPEAPAAWEVSASGGERQMYEGNLMVVSLQLAARNAAGQETVSAPLVLRARCSSIYFFDFPNGCATRPALPIAAREQTFEGGRMVWVERLELSGPNVIILYADPALANQWVVVEDAWQAGQPEHDPALTPPAGRFQPQRGLGKIWREWPLVRERLGWATGPEQTFQSFIQYNASASELFFQSGPSAPGTVTWLSAGGFWKTFTP